MTCYNCFNEYSGQFCPRCGYDAAAAKRYPLALRPGTILGGRYIVGKVLGEGGFGITYVAQDYDSKKLVAIKEHFPSNIVTRTEQLTVSLINEDMRGAFLEGKEKFLEEAKTLSQFNGLDNICDIYSYFEENGTAYFAMEYVQGMPLDAFLKKNGRVLGFDEALELMQPIMEALGHVHERGIIHRDISPDNIMVRADGSAMLIDFGAARYSMGEKSRSLDLILKHGFAPKEQYARRGRQGAYTDVYAMAATFYYAITGKVPPEAIERIDDDELVPPSKLGIRIPHKSEQALMKALAVDFKQRFQSMKDFAGAIAAKKKNAAGKKRGKKTLRFVAALLVLALLGGAAGAYAAAEKARDRGQVWRITSNGTLIVSGGEAMPDYKEGEAPWEDRKDEIKAVKIRKGVTTVGNNAFSGCSALEKISLPSTLEKIGHGAFYGCSALESLELPDSLTEIGMRSFAGCEKLEYVKFPDRISIISYMSFGGCRELRRISLPEGLKQIEALAFSGCDKLDELEYRGTEAELKKLTVDGGNSFYNDYNGRFWAEITYTG